MKIFNKIFLFFVLLPVFFIWVDKVEAGPITNLKGTIYNQSMSAPSTFELGSVTSIDFSASFTSGHQVEQCDYQGDPRQTPYEMDIYIVTSWAGTKKVTLSDILREPRESPLCTGIPTLREELRDVTFRFNNIDDLSAGDYWVRFEVDGYAPVTNTFLNWDRTINFTITPQSKPNLNVNSCSLAPNLLLSGDGTTMSFTVTNNGDAPSGSFDVVVTDNGSIYKSYTGLSLAKNNSLSRSATKSSVTGAGTHTFEVQVDPNNNVSETVETSVDNNCSRTATVSLPPTVDLTADSTSIAYNTATTLRWSTSNVTSSCTASGDWSGSKSSSGGSIGTGNLTSSKTYNISCPGALNSTATDSVTVNVGAAPSAPTVTLSANPTSVSSGGSTTLTWSSTNATSCTATAGAGFSTGGATSGSDASSSLTSNTTFTVSCTGAGGTGTASASVTVSPESNNTSTINTTATLDGSPWTGAISYQILGPATINGSSVNTSHSDLDAGTWTISYVSGGPNGAILDNISNGVETKTVAENGTISFVFNFLTETPDTPDLITNALSARNISTGQSGNSFLVGDNIKFDGTVFNQGTANTNTNGDGSFIIRFTRNGTVVSDETASALASSSSIAKSSNTWVATEGSWTIQACADQSNLITELNESNNCRSITITVSTSGGPGGGTQCSDGVDNDGDGWVDEEDPDCLTSGGNGPSDGGTYDPDDDSEDSGAINPPQCSDGIDNDEDGFIDGNDPQCASAGDDTEDTIRFEEF